MVKLNFTPKPSLGGINDIKEGSILQNSSNYEPLIALIVVKDDGAKYSLRYIEWDNNLSSWYKIKGAQPLDNINHVKIKSEYQIIDYADIRSLEYKPTPIPTTPTPTLPPVCNGKQCKYGEWCCNGDCRSCPSGQTIGPDCWCYPDCGGLPCKDGTCCNGKCKKCNEGFIVGSDCECHPQCSPGIYCTRGSECCNGRCLSCSQGYVMGNDCECYPSCGSNTYCKIGTCCGGKCCLSGPCCSGKCCPFGTTPVWDGRYSSCNCV